MKRHFIISACIAFGALSAWAQDAPSAKESFDYNGTQRTYVMHMPENLRAGAPLVVYVHGYGSQNPWQADLNAVADRHGFAVCYPDGLPDSLGKKGWKVGYPPQESLDIDEADYFRHLLDEVCGRYGLSRENVFCAGFSNGGDLCYQFAYTAPDIFRAYASVAGLTFECTYLPCELTLPVPFMEIHGTADKVSMWNGDHANEGGWGAYIPVPLAVDAIAANNRCTTAVTDTVPTLPGSDRIVLKTVYGNSPSGAEVVLYRIEEGKHSWADKDIATSEIIWNFFESYLKKD